jgi:hypothetical protein
MRYDIVEQALIDIIKPLLLSNGQPLAQKCEPYDGEFEVPFETPESYHPGVRYALSDTRGAIGTSQSANGQQVAIAGDIAIFVGSENSTRLGAKKEIYEMLDILQTHLHRKTLKNGSTVIGRLRWKSDQKEFGTPNHICFSMTFALETSIRIENG